MARQRGERLYSLSEVSARTGISLQSLRRYRTLFSDRVPSTGEGRRQRFPAGALPVFQQLKEEGMARRGRGRKRAASGSLAAGAGRKRRGRKRGGITRPARPVAARRGNGRRGRAAAATASNRDSLLTLVEIGRRTGISYPTLLRYVRLHLDQLPHTGSGRKRRFRPAAVEQFQKLRSESRRGRRAAVRADGASPALSRQLARLERGQRSLALQIRDLRRALARPVRVRLER
jgi:DNA-binding transcriptional MerR regulator